VSVNGTSDPFDAFDQLATMVAVTHPDGRCLRANSALENTLGQSRRALQRGSVFDWLIDPAPMRESLRQVAHNTVATGRFEAMLKRPVIGLGTQGGAGTGGELPVHVIVSQMDRPEQVLVEMIEVEQQTRLEREERTHGLVQANKELVRNLAHEIKNPLGGIRGAAQLLQMEVASKELTEYTQVIIHEADRLQSLVDRLLAPHRRPQVMADVNIHEICERVRAVTLAEHPRGLQVVRDYDTSIPDFRGDREQLIQAVLNIVHNATQALGGAEGDSDSPHAARIAKGSAQIVLRTRVARQVTFGRQRFRLALELHVQDNGPGVPEAVVDRIFQPLVSGRDGGSGLGLTLAQTFVQQHQGTIECDSVPGRTVFKLLIPLPAGPHGAD
jgi:two-component system, NtrC family, nitrogen regulation sensor histidine kinase GlnL